MVIMNIITFCSDMMLNSSNWTMFSLSNGITRRSCDRPHVVQVTNPGSEVPIYAFDESVDSCEGECGRLVFKVALPYLLCFPDFDMLAISCFSTSLGGDRASNEPDFFLAPRNFFDSFVLTPVEDVSVDSAP